jgi:DNA (cytosine-5)-methyltransferase 1
MKMRPLDLFCGASGAATGYHRAGLDVVVVDIEPQPNYSFGFMQMDALVALERCDRWGDSFDAIHASPPCQHGSSIAKQQRIRRPVDVSTRT